MASQTHYYPCNETKSSLCTTCNAGLTSKQGTDGTSGTDGNSYSSPRSGTKGKSNKLLCSAFCNASCNSRYCQSSQAYCNISHQYIKNHGDVGSFPIPKVCGGTSGETNPANYTIIREAWTSSNWNSLIDKLETAEIVGKQRR